MVTKRGWPTQGEPPWSRKPRAHGISLRFTVPGFPHSPCLLPQGRELSKHSLLAEGGTGASGGGPDLREAAEWR